MRGNLDSGSPVVLSAYANLRELADALMEQLQGDGSDQSEDDDGFDAGDVDDVDEGGEDDDEDEDDEETAEKKAKIRQFASEIKQLEAAIDKKRAGFQGGNPIMIVSAWKPSLSRVPPRLNV